MGRIMWLTSIVIGSHLLICCSVDTFSGCHQNRSLLNHFDAAFRNCPVPDPAGQIKPLNDLKTSQYHSIPYSG